MALTDRNPIDGNDISKYYEGTDTLVFIYNQLLDSTNPTIPVSSLSVNAAAAGATTLSLVTPTLAPLSKKQRIVAGSSCFALSSDAATGATSLSVYPLLSAIPANTSATYKPMVPWYSVEESGFKLDATTISFRNYGADATDIQKRTRSTASFNGMGFVTKGDPGLNLIEEGLYGVGTWLYLQWIPPDGKAKECYMDFKSGDDKTKVDDPYKKAYDFVNSGPIIVTDLSLR